MKIQGIAQVNLPPVAGMEAIKDLSEEEGYAYVRFCDLTEVISCKAEPSA